MVDVGEVHLNVASAGSGDPVLLLHGFPDSWHLWRHQIMALAAAGYRVIAPDLRGHGGSSRPQDVGAYRMPQLLADVAAVLAHFGHQRAAVVGHDWGAAIAWNLAFRRPEAVSKLAVLSVGHPGAGITAGIPQRQLSWYMLWFLFPGVAEKVLPADDWQAFREWAWPGTAPGSNQDMTRQLSDLARPGALAAGLNLYRANIRPDSFYLPADSSLSPINSMPRVGCPTLGIWSADDPYLGEEQMSGSGSFVDGDWRFAKVRGGHWIPVQAADRLNELLLEFLR